MQHSLSLVTILRPTRNLGFGVTEKCCCWSFACFALRQTWPGAGQLGGNGWGWGDISWTWKALHFACGLLEASSSSQPCVVQPHASKNQRNIFSLWKRASKVLPSQLCVWVGVLVYVCARPLNVIFDRGHISLCSGLLGQAQKMWFTKGN